MRTCSACAPTLPIAAESSPRRSTTIAGRLGHAVRSSGDGGDARLAGEGTIALDEPLAFDVRATLSRSTLPGSARFRKGRSRPRERDRCARRAVARGHRRVDRGRIAPVGRRARRHGARQDHRHRGARRRGRRARRRRARRREGQRGMLGRRDRVRRRPAEARRRATARRRLAAHSPRRPPRREGHGVARAGQRRHRRSRAGRAPARGRGIRRREADARVAWAQIPGVPPGKKPIELDLDARDVVAASVRLASIAANVRGTSDEHRAVVRARIADNDVETSLAGALDGETMQWRGALEAFRSSGAADIRLEAPAELELARDRVALASARRASPPMASSGSSTPCWSSRAGSRRTARSPACPRRRSRLAEREPALHDRRRVRRGLVDRGDPPPRRHDLDPPRARRRARHDARPGHLARGRLIGPRARPRRALRQRCDRRQCDARLRAERKRHAGVRDRAFAHRRAGHVSRRRAAHRALRRRMAVAQAAQPWLGTTATADGRLRVALEATGTLGRRSWRETSRRGAALRRAAVGPALRRGRPFRDHRQGRGHARRALVFRGDGTFRASGTRRARAARASQGLGTKLAWTATRLRVLNRPDRRIVATGEGTLALVDGRLAIAGSVSVDEGRIEHERTPGATPSPDVVVRGRPPATASRDVLGTALALTSYVDCNCLSFAGKGWRPTWADA